MDDGGALRNAKQGKSLSSARFDHALEITHEAVERDIRRRRQSDSPLPRAS